MSRPPAPDEPLDVPQDILDTPHAAQLVVRGGVWRVLSYVVANALAVVSAAVIVRYLGVRDLGRYTTVVSLMAIISGVFEAGLTNLGVREASVLHGAERERFLRDLLGLRLAVASVGAVVAIVVTLAIGYPAVIVAGTAVASIGVVVYTLQTHYATALQTELRLGWFSSLEFLRQVAFTVFALLFVALNLGLLAMLAVPVPAHLVVLVATLLIVRRSLPLGVSFAASRWRPLLARSVPVAAATAIGAVYSYVSVLVMSIVSTEEQTGYFSAGFRVIVVLLAIPGLLIGAVLPILSRAARDDRERLEGGLQRTLEVSTLMGAALALLTVIGAPVAIAIVAGPDFDPSVSVLQILGVALLPTSLIAYGGYALLSMGAFRQVMVCNAIGLTVTVALAFALASRWDADGAAVANLVGESTIAAAFLIALRGQGVSTHYRPPLLAICATIPGIVLAVAVPWPPVVEAAAAGALFLGAALALGIVPPELRAALLRRPAAVER